jgi:zinc transport system ATP-binding protein
MRRSWGRETCGQGCRPPGEAGSHRCGGAAGNTCSGSSRPVPSQPACRTIARVPELVRIDNLDFAYGQQLALKQITLAVDRGSLLGVIGPNGGGKTTLLRLLLGLLQPTRGSIRIAGLPPRQAVQRGNLLGYLPQSLNLPADFPISVRQLVELGLTGRLGMLRPPAREDREFCTWLLERVGLSEQAERPIGSISGGQRQRALIARALAPRPALLLLDEPLTGIDRSGQRRFMEFILDLRRQLDLTIILVTHDLATVRAMADRIACLNVALHCHDVPERVQADMLRQVFACDVEAAGIGRPAGGGEE